MVEQVDILRAMSSPKIKFCFDLITQVTYCILLHTYYASQKVLLYHVVHLYHVSKSTVI